MDPCVTLMSLFLRTSMKHLWQRRRPPVFLDTRCTPLGMFFFPFFSADSLKLGQLGCETNRGDIFIFLVPPEMLDGFKSGLWLGSLWNIPGVVSKLLLCCLGGVVQVSSEG